MNRSIVTTDVLEEKLDAFKNSFFTGLMAKIETYDKTNRKAKVQPLEKIKTKTGFEFLPVVTLPVQTFFGNNIEIIPDYKKGDIVYLAPSRIPTYNMIKGQAETDNSILHALQNMVILPGFQKQPSILNPLVISDGIVICHSSTGTRFILKEDEIDIIMDSSTSIKIKKDEVKIKSKKLIVDGDVEILGKLEVDKDITWDNASTPTKAKTHTHPTAVPGPPSPPTPGT